MRVVRLSKSIVPALLIASIPLLAAGALPRPAAPASDDEVLLVLPGSPVHLEVAALRARLAQRPDDVVLAELTTDRLLALGRSEADPRYHGYAEAIIDAALAHHASSPRLWLHRADVLQHRHDFSGALAALERAFALGLDEPRAHLMRALIHLTLGDAAAAQRDCGALIGRASALLAATCALEAESLRGRLSDSYRALRRIVATRGEDEPDIAWARGSLAEMAARLGEADEADFQFREALRTSPDDVYLMAAYADFLLDSGRPHAARALLMGRERQDALLLRAALAAAMAHEPDADELARRIRTRLRAQTARGDTASHRARARVALHLDGDPARALALAQAGFRHEKAPADLRVLRECAAAAGVDLPLAVEQRARAYGLGGTSSLGPGAGAVRP